MKTRTRTRRPAALAVAALLTLALTACGGSDDGDETADDPAPSSDTGAAEEPATVLPEWAPEVLTEGDDVVGLDFADTPEPDPELLVETLVEGDGEPVQVGQTLTVDYFGAVYQGEEPFDESYSGEPVQFPIGVGNLIAGWDEGIPGVPVGSRIIMSIPPDKGYGDTGQGPIPAGSTLYFVIDVIDAV